MPLQTSLRMPRNMEDQVRADLVRISAPALRPQAVTTHTSPLPKPSDAIRVSASQGRRNPLVPTRAGSKRGLSAGTSCLSFPKGVWVCPALPSRSTEQLLVAPLVGCVCVCVCQRSASCGPASSVCVRVCARAHPWNAIATPLNLVGSKFGVFALILAAG